MSPLIVSVLFILLYLYPLPGASTAERTITEFSDGETEIVLDFPGEATETVTIEIPHLTRVVESGILLERLRTLEFLEERRDMLPNIAGAAAGDYDRDGDVDVALFTAGPEDNLLLENSGDGSFTRTNIPGAFPARGGAWGDHDNDGDLDLAVVGPGDNRLYRWNGDGFSSKVEFGNASSLSACWGDINNDGWLDLVLGNDGDNQVFVWFDDGYRELPLFGAHRTNAVACGDLDNDGLIDVVVGNEGPDYFFRNLGTGQFSQTMLSGSGNTNSVHLYDLDRDGVLDILAAMEGNNRIYWYQSQGTFTHTEIETPLSTTSMYASDLDLDGHLDILEGNWGGGNRVLLGDGERGFTPGPELGWGATVALLPEDIDKDGDVDAVVVNSNDRWELHRSGYCTDLDISIDVGADSLSDARFPSHYPPASFLPEFGTLNTTTIAWGDHDNDGDPDLAVGNYGGQNLLYTNNGAGTFVPMLQFGSGLPLSMSWGDHDNDGDLDLAMGNNGQNQLFTNTGSGFDQRSEFGSGYSLSLEWADMNLDGLLDLIVINYGSNNRLYINRGTHFEETNAFGSGASVALAVGDFDNDGDADVAIGKFHSEPHKLFVNEYGTSFSEHDAFGSRAILTMEPGDFDRDGDLDLAVSHKGGGNAVYLNEGDSYRETAALGEGDAVAMEVTDHDLDGCLDVLMSSLAGVLETYSGDDAGGFELSMSADLNTTVSSLAVARADEDAYPDLALGTTAQNLYCANAADSLLVRDIEEAVNGYVIHMEEMRTDENISVPVVLASGGPGRVQLSRVKMRITEPPRCFGIPSIFTVEEDTMEYNICDLSVYFHDDIDRSTDLGYFVRENSREGIVYCQVVDGRYLAVDAETGPSNDNFTGEVELVVEARDSSNLSVLSDPFTIAIVNVNDHPAVHHPLGDIVLNESEGYELDLAGGSYFTDGDGDEMYFDVLVDPMNEERDQVNLSAFVRDDILVIETGVNYTCTSLPLWIFADDDEDVDMPGSSTNFVCQKIAITIHNINDPPVFLDIDDVLLFVNQDLNDAFNAEDFVIDSDTPGDELTIRVDGLSDEKNFDVRVDGDHFIDIKLLRPDFSGTCRVSLSVSDGEYVDTGEFDIVVREKNHPPTCSLMLPRDGAVMPTSSVELLWEGEDEDGDPISYRIYFSRSSTGSGFFRKGYAGTSVVIDGLLDDTTYYWQIFPEDRYDAGKCLDSMFSFTVDLDVDVPRVTLLFPENDAEVRTSTATLSWYVDYPGKLAVSYDVLFYNDSERPRTYMSDHEGEHIMVSGLVMNETYYWTVIPRAGNIQGECTTGTYRFTVPEIREQSYAVELIFEGDTERKPVVSGAPGARIIFNITIHNRVTERCTITLVANGHPGIMGNLQFVRDSFVLHPADTGKTCIDARIIIDLPEGIPGNKYLVTVTAFSGDVALSQELQVIVNVEENVVTVPPRGGADRVYWMIPAAVAGLLAALVLFVVIARRRARKLSREDTSVAESGKSGRAISLRNGEVIEVEKIEPRRPTPSHSPEDRRKRAGRTRSGTRKYAGVYTEPSGSSALGEAYPIFNVNPYDPSGGNQPELQHLQYPLLYSYGMPLPDYRKEAKDFYEHISGIIVDAKGEGADTTDAENVMEDALEMLESGGAGDYMKAIEYCTAAGNAVNRALSRLEKLK